MSDLTLSKTAPRWREIHKLEQAYVDVNKSNFMNFKARLFGYLAGDGNIYTGNGTTNFHHSARFYPDHDSLIPPFCEAFLKVYNKNPKIKKLKNHFCLTVDSKVIIKDIIKNGDFGLHKWNIPYKILVDEECKIEWLRAFFDCESYVGKNHVKLQSVNEAGIRQVRELLSEFGITSKLYHYRPKSEKWSDVHIIVINGIMRKKFQDVIGFNHGLKTAKLEESLKIYK